MFLRSGAEGFIYPMTSAMARSRARRELGSSFDVRSRGPPHLVFDADAKRGPLLAHRQARPSQVDTRRSLPPCGEVPASQYQPRRGLVPSFEVVKPGRQPAGSCLGIRKARMPVHHPDLVSASVAAVPRCHLSRQGAPDSSTTGNKQRHVGDARESLRPSLPGCPDGMKSCV